LFKTSRLVVGLTQPPVEWVIGVHYLGVNCPHTHTSPSSAKVKNEWSCRTIPLLLLYDWIAWQLKLYYFLIFWCIYEVCSVCVNKWCQFSFAQHLTHTAFRKKPSHQQAFWSSLTWPIHENNFPPFL